MIKGSVLIIIDEFLYKREVNKSVLWDGFGVERQYLKMFLSRIAPINRGEKREIFMVLNGHTYSAEIKNLNNPTDKRINDAYQIRYASNGEFAQALRGTFYKTYTYIQKHREIEEKTGEKKRIFTAIPDDYKEYLAIYTTNEPTTFVCEPILSDDISVLREATQKYSERIFESAFNYDWHDDTAGFNTKEALDRLRKLNRKIGDTLKEHYQYRCQICGRVIEERYGSKIVEAHHIDYFVKSLNNDMTNILIVCPNHHSIIHDRNPEFDRTKCIYRYPNGYTEGLILNDHL